MRISGTRHTPRAAYGRVTRRQGTTRAAAALTAAGLALGLAGCAGSGKGTGEQGARENSGAAAGASGKVAHTRLPGVGERFQQKIPAKTRQVVAVYGKGKDSPDATVRLYTRKAAGKGWKTERSWPAHNGKKGWTPRHHEGDKRSPDGVYTLSDAGGVLAAPGAKLPYRHTAAFTPPSYWQKSTRHDFDRVIAIDYNRAKGTSPLDPKRPWGQERGGSIWLHVDHGSGTSGCVTLHTSAMRHLLRTLDPAAHPAVVMGDKATLAG